MTKGQRATDTVYARERNEETEDDERPIEWEHIIHSWLGLLQLFYVPFELMANHNYEYIINNIASTLKSTHESSASQKAPQIADKGESIMVG